MQFNQTMDLDPSMATVLTLFGSNSSHQSGHKKPERMQKTQQGHSSNDHPSQPFSQAQKTSSMRTKPVLPKETCMHSY